MYHFGTNVPLWYRHSLLHYLIGNFSRKSLSMTASSSFRLTDLLCPGSATVTEGEYTLRAVKKECSSWRVLILGVSSNNLPGDRGNAGTDLWNFNEQANVLESFNSPLSVINETVCTKKFRFHVISSIFWESTLCAIYAKSLYSLVCVLCVVLCCVLSAPVNGTKQQVWPFL